jgi:uncharacterized protein with PQ loop repeat
MFNLENVIGIFAGVFTAVSMLPQLIKMFREKKATTFRFYARDIACWAIVMDMVRLHEN